MAPLRLLWPVDLRLSAGGAATRLRGQSVSVDPLNLTRIIPAQGRPWTRV